MTSTVPPTSTTTKNDAFAALGSYDLFKLSTTDDVEENDFHFNVCIGPSTDSMNVRAIVQILGTKYAVASYRDSSRGQFTACYFVFPNEIDSKTKTKASKKPRGRFLDTEEVRALGFNVEDDGNYIDPESDLAKHLVRITRRLLKLK